ncbi:MAG: XRE family transcriptional regulator [Actinobacteria bacterium]|nr:MAG: XRE family transcriptional regulator [Actinomycetota bacterium]
MSYGQRIRKRRLALNLTQDKLAKAVKVTPQHISAVKQNKSAPSLETLVKIASELGVTTDYLLTGKEVALVKIVPVIKTDKNLSLKSKKALFSLIEELHIH